MSFDLGWVALQFPTNLCVTYQIYLVFTYNLQQLYVHVGTIIIPLPDMIYHVSLKTDSIIIIRYILMVTYHSLFAYPSNHLITSERIRSCVVSPSKDSLRAIFIVLGLLTMIIIASCGEAWPCFGGSGWWPQLQAGLRGSTTKMVGTWGKAKDKKIVQKGDSGTYMIHDVFIFCPYVSVHEGMLSV